MRLHRALAVALAVAAACSSDGASPDRPGGKADEAGSVSCLFGEFLSDTLESSRLDTVEEIALTPDGEISPFQREQLVRGMALNAGAPVTFEEAFDNDDEQVTLSRLRDRETGREYDVYRFALSGAFAGFIYDADSLRIAALIGDDTIVDCATSAEAPARLDAVVTGAAIGELSPLHDVCVVMVEDRVTGRAVGLMEDFDAVDPESGQSCPQTAKLLDRQGTLITILRDELVPVADADLLADLAENLDADADYFFIEAELQDELVVAADPLPIPFGFGVTGGLTPGTLGLMHVHVAGVDEGGLEDEDVLSAILATGQGLFGNDCDGVPTGGARFKKNGSIESFFDFLREGTTDWESRMKDSEIFVLRRFLEVRGDEKVDIFFGRVQVDVCGGSGEISYNLIWDRASDIVGYLVMLPFAD